MGVRQDTADKCLRLTSAFEGHGGGVAAGNADGEVLTWGPIGFALKSGGLHAVLRRIVDLAPDALPATFADSVRLGRAPTILFVKGFVLRLEDQRRLRPDWQQRFIALYSHPAAKQAFREASARYLRKAEAVARAFHFATERGFAFALDTVVQNGSVKQQALPIWRNVKVRFAAQSDHDVEAEWVRLKALAYAVSETARAQYSKDVLSRKLTIAVGAGQVHGRFYDLAKDFGIDYAQDWEVTT